MTETDKSVKIRRKAGTNSKGVVTVFVIMIMVPVVVFTGIFVDFTRFKFVSSQAIMAADSYAEGVLGTYDNVLKQLYGLFSVSSREEGKAAIETVKQNVLYSFNPKADAEFEHVGHMPYANTDVELVHTNVEGATLQNENVFLTQIGDFMRFRIIEEMVEGSGILDAIEGIQSAAADSKAVETYSEIGDSSTRVLKLISWYYEQLESIEAYPGYIDGLKTNYYACQNLIRDTINSTQYAKYWEYRQRREEIDAAKAYAQVSYQLGGEINEELIDLAKEFEGIDDTYWEGVKGDLEQLRAAANVDNQAISFATAGQKISQLGTYAGEIEDGMNNLVDKRNELVNEELPNCSEALRAGICEEIEGLEDITEMKGNFKAVHVNIEDINQDTAKNVDNRQEYDEKLVILDQKIQEFKNLMLEPGTIVSEEEIQFEWYHFEENPMDKDFYNQLTKLCSVQEKKEHDESQKRIDSADKKSENTMKEIKEDSETPPQRSIGDLAGQLQLAGGAGEGEIGVVGDLGWSDTGNRLLAKFLLTSYNAKMFTSRVTGKPPQEDEETVSDADYKDYSLTGVEMTDQIHYLYKAELEYLFGGNTDSKKNWNATRNTICSVRMAFNFASTYAIEPVDTAIDTVAKAAEVAATASGIPGAGVLARIATSAALRGAVAGIETAMEWKQLKNRESVLLYKNRINDLEAIEELREVLPEMAGSGSAGTSTKKGLEVKLSYEDYLYLLMLLTVDTSTLVDRTCDLITLNVNQSQNSGDVLTNLEFKMSETVTAIESTCKVKMDFLVVPDAYLNMFLADTEANTIIQSWENRYTGFSLIRGY